MIHRPRCAIPRVRREDGSSIVEMAFAMMVLVGMMTGICEVSLGWYYAHFCSDGARQATRYAMVRGSASCTNTPNLTTCDATAAQIKAYVQGLGYPGVVGTSVGVTTTWYSANTTSPSVGSTVTWTVCGTECNEPGNMVKVVVTYPMTLPIPIAKSTYALHLSGTSQMVISQ